MPIKLKRFRYSFVSVSFHSKQKTKSAVCNGCQSRILFLVCVPAIFSLSCKLFDSPPNDKYNKSYSTKYYKKYFVQNTIEENQS